MNEGKPWVGEQHVSLHNFTVCLCEVRWERYVCCEVCRQGHIQHNTSGPAGSRTWGLEASARWLYPDDPGRGGRQTDRQTGRRFSLLIHDTAAISTAFCSDLICPASPTHKYFTNTSHTRDLAERPHTPSCHTPSLVLFHSPSLWFRVLFFHIFPLWRSISPSFTCQEFWSYTVFVGSRWQEIKCYVPLFHTSPYATGWLYEGPTGVRYEHPFHFTISLWEK